MVVDARFVLTILSSYLGDRRVVKQWPAYASVHPNIRPGCSVSKEVLCSQWHLSLPGIVSDIHHFLYFIVKRKELHIRKFIQWLEWNLSLLSIHISSCKLFTEPCMICCIFFQSIYLFPQYSCFHSLPIHTMMPLCCSLFSWLWPTVHILTYGLYSVYISHNLVKQFTVSFQDSTIPLSFILFCFSWALYIRWSGNLFCCSVHTHILSLICPLRHPFSYIILSVFFN
jgi:hypothetical protein